MAQRELFREATEFCTVCDRVPFGDIVPLGFGRWRHQDCAPGTRSWTEHYRTAPHTEEGDILYAYATKEGTP